MLRLALLACSPFHFGPGVSVDTTPPVFTSAPAFQPAPNASTPLSARLVVDANEAVVVVVEAHDGQRTWRFAPTGAYAAHHELALAGFRPARRIALRVELFDAAGNRCDRVPRFVFDTPPLPSSFPPLHVTVSRPQQMEPGVTLTALTASSSTLPGAERFLVYLDSAGEVVWLHRSADPIPYSAIRLSNADLLFIAGLQLARRIDLLGNVVAEWWAARQSTSGMPPGAIAVDCDNFHHELDALPRGDVADFVALSEVVRTLPNYPASEIDPSITVPSAHVLGDEVVEFRRDGTIVRRTSLFDVIDPYRICYDSLAPIASPLYGVTAHDWTHANSAELTPSGDAFLVSIRNQDAVIELERATGALRWILGSHERWTLPWSAKLLTPLGTPFEWQFHQHGPHVDASGEIVLYDNGNYRVIPPAPWGPPQAFYSRAVRYRIDANARTVQQTWEHDGATKPFFSRFFCDADPLPLTGNVLVTDGWRRVSPAVNRTYGRIVEVTGDAASAKVFEVIVNDPATPPTNPYNWSIYRSERYPSVYP